MGIFTIYADDLNTLHGFNYYFSSFWWPFTKIRSSITYECEAPSIWNAYITLTGRIVHNSKLIFYFGFDSKKPHKMAQKCLHLTYTKIAARIDFHMKNNAQLCYIIWSEARKLHSMRILCPKFQKPKKRRLKFVSWCACDRTWNRALLRQKEASFFEIVDLKRKPNETNNNNDVILYTINWISFSLYLYYGSWMPLFPSTVAHVLSRLPFFCLPLFVFSFLYHYSYCFCWSFELCLFCVFCIAVVKMKPESNNFATWI